MYVYIYTHTVEYYSTITKNEIMPFSATWMDLEIIILSEVGETEKDKYHMISLYVDSKKRYKRTYLQNRNRLTDIENKLMVTKGKRWWEG